MRRTLFLILLFAGFAAAASAARAQEPGVLDGSEQQAMTDAVQYSLEKNPTNQSAEWVNPDTGRSGSVAPVRTFENNEGQPCREFVTTITIGGKQEQGYGTACRQPDGSWQIVSDDREATPAAVAPSQPAQVNDYPPPAVYYSYPPGFYGPSGIFLSFSSVYRGGHAYHGSRYLDGRDFRRRFPLHIRERAFVGPRVYDHYPWRDRRGHGEGGEDQNRGGRQDHRSGEGQRWGDPDHSRDDRDRRGR